MTRKTILLLAAALSCASLFAQNNDSAVAISGGPPLRAWTVEYKYVDIGGTDYIEYICYATTQQPLSRISVTQIADAANVSTFTTSEDHGLLPNNRVTLAGAAGGALSLNGAQTIVSTPTATTFTIATSGIADATYNTAGMTISTYAPRTNRNIWAILRYSYGGTGGTSILRKQWAVTGSGVQGSTGQQNACDSRTTLAYQ